jgi:hypothetical protein
MRLLWLHFDPGLERAPLCRAIARPYYSIEVKSIARMQNSRQIRERLKLTRLYVEEDLLIIVHVEYAILGKYAQNNAIVSYNTGWCHTLVLIDQIQIVVA